MVADHQGGQYQGRMNPPRRLCGPSAMGSRVSERRMMILLGQLPKANRLVIASNFYVSESARVGCLFANLNARRV